MTFKYCIVATKTIDMPHGNRQINYLYLTNNPNFVKDKMLHGSEPLIKDFKGNEWIQYTNYIGHHMDTVRYSKSTSLTDTKTIFPRSDGLLLPEVVKMTNKELRNKYRYYYILDI
ncbi:MAG: hypothetical protein KAI79_17070 [Bacteroidales bacterium]|nr:hypothetical protein [Bacteroidales bacterium]